LTLSPAESTRFTIKTEDEPHYAPLKESDGRFMNSRAEASHNSESDNETDSDFVKKKESIF
jgi:hypothetical protein